jgi:hypothetical protein
MVAIKAIARVFDMGLKPNGWRSEADVRIVCKKYFARLGAGPRDHPSIGTF